MKTYRVGGGHGLGIRWDVGFASEAAARAVAEAAAVAHPGVVLKIALDRPGNKRKVLAQIANVDGQLVLREAQGEISL